MTWGMGNIFKKEISTLTEEGCNAHVVFHLDFPNFLGTKRHCVVVVRKIVGNIPSLQYIRKLQKIHKKNTKIDKPVTNA